MNKVLSFLLCLYVMAMTLMPCHCELETCNYIGSHTEQAIEEHDGSKALEICSPFCCCANVLSVNFYEDDNVYELPGYSVESRDGYYYLLKSPFSLAHKIEAPPKA